jgi:hypothetical protein
MRRLLFTLAATGLLIVLAPAAALAQHHHRHATHTTRAHHTRIRRFGDLTTQPTTTTTGSSDTVGTVQSFSNGVLTILLNDNSTVSGTVTSATGIECGASGQSQTTHDDGDPSSGTQTSGSDNETSGTDNETSSTDNETSSTESQSTGDDDQGEDQGQSSSCSSADLTSGKAVHAAELRISSGGNTWSKVELVS